MHRSQLGIFVVITLAVGMIPAASAENMAAQPVKEVVTTSQATRKFVPSPHPTVRIVLGDAGHASMTGPDGTLKCLPQSRPVELSPSAISVAGDTVQVDYGPHEKDEVVEAVIVDGYYTVDTNLMGAGANRGNELFVPDVKFHMSFLDSKKTPRVMLCVVRTAITSSS